MASVTALKTTSSSSVNNERRPLVKKAQTYRQPEKNAQAVVQATNWLKAANIAVKPSQMSGSDLVVRSKAGKDIEIKVATSESEPRPAIPHLMVLASELTNRSKARALAAFHSITSATGHGTPLPINRGTAPEKKLHFDDNFELVAMRHSEFRKVPNPSAEDLAHFEKVIAKAVSRFLYINGKICRRHGLGFDDLRTYAQVWTCNYLGLYFVPNPTQNDNERKLYAHLVQRFHNFLEVLLKKERNCIPDSQTAFISQTGTPYQGRLKDRAGSVMGEFDADMSFEDVREAEMEAEVDAMAELPDIDLDFISISASDEAEEAVREQKVTDAKRRKLAQKALAEQLGSMDHDTLVAVLTQASTSTFISPDARDEAKKQLRFHRESCASCAAEASEGVN